MKLRTLHAVTGVSGVILFTLVVALGLYVERAAWQLGVDVSRRDLIARARTVRVATLV